MKNRNNLIFVVSAPGGHFSVAEELFNGSKYNFKFILTIAKGALKTRPDCLYVTESNRDFRFFIQFYQALKLILEYKPSLIVSTGAGVAISFFLCAKLFNIPSVFIETASRVRTLSLSGKISYFLASRFYVRNKHLAQKLNRAIQLEK